jgi:plasmid maintenance system antidote protein VapI
MDTEKQAELVRLHILMRQATDSLHTQATEIHEIAKKLEELTKDTTIRHATLIG